MLPGVVSRSPSLSSCSTPAWPSLTAAAWRRSSPWRRRWICPEKLSQSALRSFLHWSGPEIFNIHNQERILITFDTRRHWAHFVYNLSQSEPISIILFCKQPITIHNFAYLHFSIWLMISTLSQLSHTSYYVFFLQNSIKPYLSMKVSANTVWCLGCCTKADNIYFSQNSNRFFTLFFIWENYFI